MHKRVQAVLKVWLYIFYIHLNFQFNFHFNKLLHLFPIILEKMYKCEG